MPFSSGKNNLLATRVGITDLVIAVWPFVGKIGNDYKRSINALENLMADGFAIFDLIHPQRRKPEFHSCPLKYKFVYVIEDGIPETHYYERLS